MSINPNTQRILDALAPKHEQHEVPGFGKVLIRQMGLEQVSLLKIETDKMPFPGLEFGLGMLVASVMDLDGNPLFDSPDLPALRASGHRAMDLLINRVLRVNGFLLGELEKNV